MMSTCIDISIMLMFDLQIDIRNSFVVVIGIVFCLSYKVEIMTLIFDVIYSKKYFEYLCSFSNLKGRCSVGRFQQVCAGERVCVPRAPQVCKLCGTRRVAIAPVHEGKGKENRWVLVSKSHYLLLKPKPKETFDHFPFENSVEFFCCDFISGCSSKVIKVR